MKCSNCGGTGKEIFFTNVGKCIDVCLECDGRGFIEPITNEEWFDSLTTNEKAYHLADICAWAMEEFRCGKTEKANTGYWQKWLKQPHTVKE